MMFKRSLAAAAVTAALIAPNVVFADRVVLKVANLLLLSVMIPKVPPPKFSAMVVGLPVVRPEVNPSVPEPVGLEPEPVSDKFKVVKAFEEIVELP